MSHSAERLLLLAAVGAAMLCLGAAQSDGAFRNLLRQPRAFVIGLASQFGLMPLLSYSLARILDLPAETALGLVLVGCTPGGLASNLLTQILGGNVSLSIAMTMASTLSALFMMPLLLAIYATPFTSATLTIPYGLLVTSLAVLLVPLLVGRFIYTRRPGWAPAMDRAANIIGILVLLYLTVTWFPRNGHLLDGQTLALPLAGTLLTVIGYLGGYGASWLAGLPPADRRAVCFETGVQNANLTIAIIMLSFPTELHHVLTWPALIYTLAALIVSWGMVIVLKLSGRLSGRQ